MSKIYKPTRLYIKRHDITGLKYFGKSQRKNVDVYLGSGTYWNNHLNKHGKEHVSTIWVSLYFDNQKEIMEFAAAFSEIFDIVNSNEWANLREENGIDGGDPGPEGRLKISNIQNDPYWKNTTGKIAAAKMSSTKNSIDWKNTTGKIQKNKELTTKSDPIWKETIGKDAREKFNNTINSTEWKEAVGKNKYKKHSDYMSQLMNSPIWKETIGKDAREKAGESISKTKNDPEWKKKNTKECPHCLTQMISNLYVRYHGDKCKKLKAASE